MKRVIAWVLLGLVLLVCLCASCLLASVVILRPDWLPFDVPGITRDRIVLRLPDGGLEADYVLLRPRQTVDRGAILAEDSLEPSASTWMVQSAQGFQPRSVRFGAFLPESGRFLYRLQGEGESAYYLLSRGAREPERIFESEAEVSSVLSLNGGDAVFFIEDQGTGRVRCYLSQAGQEAERSARGDSCQVSANGATLLVSDASAGGFTLTAMNLDGSGETVLLDEVDDATGEFRISPDGARVAYARADEETFAVVVLRRDDGTIVAEQGGYYGVAGFDFSPQGTALYVIGETESGDLSLTLLDGEVSAVASGQAMQAAFTPDGLGLVYLTADDAGEAALLVHPTAGGDDVAVLDGGHLSFTLLRSPDAILIHQDLEGEVILYTAQTTGESLAEILSFDRLALMEVFDLPDDSRFLVQTNDDEGRSTLAVASPAGEAAYDLLEDWASLRLLSIDPDGRRMTLVGQEDARDDPVLYAIDLEEGASPVQLDDRLDGVLNAYFSSDGREILYTVSTGTDADEVEVRQVRPDGRRAPEALYPEAALEAVSWDVDGDFPGPAVRFLSQVTTSGLCPGAPAIAPGETLEDELEAGARNCYRFRASDPLQFTIGVLADSPDLDSRLEIYDRRGDLIASDDDGGPGLNARLRLTLESSGLYYIYVFGYSGDDSGPYRLTFTEGLPGTVEDEAAPIAFGETVRGSITAESEVFIEQFDATIFAAVYSFEAEAEDWIVVDLAARSIGSAIEPVVGLFDENFELQTFAEPGPGQEPQLVYSIPAAGRYFLLVFSPNEDFGSSEDYFFEITLTRGTPPEPGGGPIEDGETVEGTLQRGIHDEWTFTAEAGEFVTIAMNSTSFDTYLELYSPTGVLLTQNDDAGGTLNSMIRFFRIPATATYTIFARSYGGTQTGPYTLSLTSGGPADAAAGSIEPGASIESELEIGEWEAWTFEGVAGQGVRIRMTSGDFDSFIELLGPDGSTLTTDDDGAGFPDSLIDRFVLPEAGLYTIIARCLGDQEGGSYRLSLEMLEE
jgi:Tol biopolymer transport system component